MAVFLMFFFAVWFSSIQWLQDTCVNTKKGQSTLSLFCINGERGIRTLDTGFPVYSLSRRAPLTILGHLSKYIVLEIIIYLNYFIMSNKKYRFLKKAVTCVLFVFLYRFAGQTLHLCHTLVLKVRIF